MLLENKNIGFALTASFYTYEKTISQISKLIEEGANVIPIMSFNSYKTDTRFSKAKEFIKKIETITKNKIIHTIEEAETIGPKRMTDIMVVAPCTRKYNRKNGKWNSGYTSANSGEITFEK